MATSNPYTTLPSYTARNTMQLAPQPSQPRPLFFLSRNNGLLVPLIPADELPFNIRLQGVSRVMQFDQTYGMQHVGTAQYTGMTYKLESETTMLRNPTDNTMLQRSNSQPPTAVHARTQSTFVNPVKQYLAPDVLARQALAQSASNQITAITSINPQRPGFAHETATTWRSNIPATSATSNPVDTTQSVIDAILSSTSGAAEAARIGYIAKSTVTPPSGHQPDETKKEFCTYWIRTGECDYMQQGCLYKHEMPDKATLEKIGFRTWPRWWAEKQSAVKLGGVVQKASVGPIMSSSEWLKSKSKPTSDEEADSESDGEGEASKSEKSAGGASVKGNEEKIVSVVVKMPVMPKHTKAMEQAVEKPVEKSSVSKVVRTSPPTIDLRKASTSSDLLLDFAVPLLPSPPSSTPSLTPANSVESSPRTGQSSPVTPSTQQPSTFKTTLTATNTTAPGTAGKVFVPKGESPAHHIAEAKKRAARQQQQHSRLGAPTSRSASDDNAAIQSLQKHIQELQKARAHEQGSMASKHAPANAIAQIHDQRNQTQARKTMRPSACRVRRPASSPQQGQGQAVLTTTPVTVLKREG